MAVQSVGFWQLFFWDSGLESRWEHGYLSHASILCCQVVVFATILSFAQRSPNECVFVCVDH
jgi:hypothetical protein